MNAFQKANLVYQTAERAAFVTHRISHPLFREFSFQLQNLIRALGEEIEVSDWKNFVRRMKYYRFEQLAAPLGFANPAAMPVENLEELKEILRRLRFASPDYVSRGETVFELLNELMNEGGNPVLDKLIEITDESEKLPIVINESRLIKPSDEVLISANLAERFDILGESQLRRNVNFDEIACFGASRWYSEYVFTAPRAGKIHLLQFDWLRDKIKSRSVFISPLKSSNTLEIPQENEFEAEMPTENFLESADIIPSINFVEIAESYSSRKYDGFRESGETEETVVAKFFILEGRQGVFLEENSRALVIDLDYEPLVRKRRVSEIASGNFILLRDKGDGDFIVPLANKILGKDASKLRQFQHEWKQTLHNLVNEIGADQTVSRLKNLGARRANRTNLRNWIAFSERNINTRYEEDYDALIKLAGYEHSLEECRVNAKRLRSAHQKAGNQIRRMLIQKVSETDLSELEKYGEMQFDMAESSGKLVARRVVRAENNFEVEVKQLNRQFRLEEN